MEKTWQNELRNKSDREHWEAYLQAQQIRIHNRMDGNNRWLENLKLMESLPPFLKFSGGIFPPANQDYFA